MGIDSWVARGTFPPLFEVAVMSCVLSLYFFRVDIFVLMHAVFIG